MEVSTKCYSFASTGFGFYTKATDGNVMIATWKRSSNIHSVGYQYTYKDYVEDISMSGRATDILNPLSKL